MLLCVCMHIKFIAIHFSRMYTKWKCDYEISWFRKMALNTHIVSIALKFYGDGVAVASIMCICDILQYIILVFVLAIDKSFSRYTIRCGKSIPLIRIKILSNIIYLVLVFGFVSVFRSFVNQKWNWMFMSFLQYAKLNEIFI